MHHTQDNSDAQYRAFRSNVPALSVLVLVYVVLKSIYTRFATHSMSGRPTDNSFIVPFIILFAVLYLIGLHGTSTLKIFIILTANYFIGKSFGRSRAGPIITWIANSLILFANERNEGYLFASLHPDLAPLVSGPFCVLHELICHQDSFRGLYPRWHISFNITMLRLVSFNMDYYWACALPHPPEVGACLSTCMKSHSSTTARINAHRKATKCSPSLS